MMDSTIRIEDIKPLGQAEDDEEEATGHEKMTRLEKRGKVRFQTT